VRIKPLRGLSIYDQASISSIHKEERTMFKLTIRYARYAMSTLATIGFGVRLN
jgi:hypothetical protein